MWFEPTQYQAKAGGDNLLNLNSAFPFVAQGYNIINSI